RAKAMLFSLGLLTSLKGLFAEETLSRIEIATGDFPFYYGCFKEIFGKDDGIRLFLALALNSIKRSQTWTDWFDGIRFLSLSALMDNPERLSEFLQKNGPSLLKVTRDFKPMYLEGLVEIEFSNPTLNSLKKLKDFEQEQVRLFISGTQALDADLSLVRYRLTSKKRDAKSRLHIDSERNQLVRDLFAGLPPVSPHNRQEIDHLLRFLSALHTNAVLSGMANLRGTLAELRNAVSLLERAKDSRSWSLEQCFDFFDSHQARLKSVSGLYNSWIDLQQLQKKAHWLNALPAAPSERFQFLKRHLGGQKHLDIRQELEQLPQKEKAFPGIVESELRDHAVHTIIDTVNSMAYRTVLPRNKQLRFHRLAEEIEIQREALLEEAKSGNSDKSRPDFRLVLEFNDPLIKKARQLIANLSKDLQRTQTQFNLVKPLLNRVENLPAVMKLLDILEILLGLSANQKDAMKATGILQRIRPHDEGYACMDETQWNKVLPYKQKLEAHKAKLEQTVESNRALQGRSLETAREQLKRELAEPGANKRNLGAQMAGLSKVEKKIKKGKIAEAREEVENGELEILGSLLTDDFWQETAASVQTAVSKEELKEAQTKKTEVDQKLAQLKKRFFTPELTALIQESVLPPFYDLILEKLLTKYGYKGKVGQGAENPLLQINGQFLPDLLNYTAALNGSQDPKTKMLPAPYRIARASLHNYLNSFSKTNGNYRQNMVEKMCQGLADNRRIFQEIEDSFPADTSFWFDRVPTVRFEAEVTVTERDIRRQFNRFFRDSIGLLRMLKRKHPPTLKMAKDSLRRSGLWVGIGRHRRTFYFQGIYFLERLNRELYNLDFTIDSQAPPVVRKEAVVALSELRHQLERLQMFKRNEGKRKKRSFSIGLLEEKLGYDLFSGNATGCCIAVNGLFQEVPFQYHADVGARILAIYESDFKTETEKRAGKKNIISAAWLWPATDPVTRETGLVLDGVETQNNYALFQNEFLDQYLGFLGRIAGRLELGFIYLRENYNDIPTRKIPTNTVRFRKTGGGVLSDSYYYHLAPEKKESVYDMTSLVVENPRANSGFHPVFFLRERLLDAQLRLREAARAPRRFLRRRINRLRGREDDWDWLYSS
ncbi:MAG: hypothetical protein GY866_01830, partial [Proteobacteria bacterium]|nr:hypothetical protein [Pseudomonadota bacterium]